MTSRDHFKKALARAVWSYVTAPARTDALLAEVCEASSRLVEDFLVDDPRWDSRSTWLDGILPSRCDIHDGSLKLAGGVFLIVSGATFMMPVVAALRASESALTTLRIQLGDATADPIPYDAAFNVHELSFPSKSTDWRYVFDLNGVLPDRPRFELPESSNFYAALQGNNSPRRIAELYRKAGWAIRKCGWHEFEVTRDIAELVIEAMPVLVHGAVAQPLDNLEAVVAPLTEGGIAFSCECYAPDGSLILQRTTAERDL